MAEIINLEDERKHQEELKGAIWATRLAFARDLKTLGEVSDHLMRYPTEDNWNVFIACLVKSDPSRVLTDDKLK